MNEKELNELEDNVSKGLIACGCTSGVPNICDIMDCPYKANGIACVHNLAFDAATLLGEFQKQLHRYPHNKDTGEAHDFQDKTSVTLRLKEVI